jgi:hypothetical protein
VGGSALLIHGTPSADLPRPREAARSFADRLLGRHPQVGPKETPLGDHVLLEIPCDPLRPLADDFRASIDRAFERPWPSTTNVRDYLAMDDVTTYLRGSRTGNEAPSWYVQLTFSACAGMADTAAEVAAHWAELWYRKAADELASKYFLPFGFTPTGIDTTGPAKLFVPLGEMGYALFYAGDQPASADPESRAFELDAAALETFDGVDLTADWQELDEALQDVRAAGACLCQFCAPRLDLSRFDRLSIVKRWSSPVD